MKGNKVITIILVIILVAGLSLLLYPTISNWWNTHHAARLVGAYSDAVETLEESEIDEMIKNAEIYNKLLATEGQYMELPASRIKKYDSQLLINDSKIMGTLEIPKIRVSLPIYHGASESVLANGVGHLDWSSLPVGGESSHCVLSGHRGLPSAKLLSDLDALKEGDIFTLTVLSKVYTYEVDQIRVVLPEDTTELMIADGKDYCTLVTCTPYGVNSHRMLVRGHRIKNIYDSRVINEAVRAEPVFVAGGMAILLLLVLLSVVIGKTGNRKRKSIKERRKKG